MITLSTLSFILSIIGISAGLISAIIAPKVEEEKFDKAVKKYFENKKKSKK